MQVKNGNKVYLAAEQDHTDINILRNYSEKLLRISKLRWPLRNYSEELLGISKIHWPLSRIILMAIN